MKIQFFLENRYYGQGSANLKGRDQPLLEVDLPTVPDTNMVIDGVWYQGKYRPTFHYKDGVLDRIEVIIRPNGGEAERKWQLGETPFHSENRS